MRIGLDARKLDDGGIGAYIRGLLAALLEAPAEDRFVAFLAPGDVGRLARGSPRLEEVPVRAGKYSLAEHWVLARAARRARVDLFHAPHYTLPLAWRGPAVVTIHDLIHVRYARFFPPGAGAYAKLVAGAAARRAGLVLADSEYTRNEVLELLGAPPARVRVIPLAVSPRLARRAPEEVEAFRRARGLPSGYVLYVGARKRHKNLELLLAALGTMKHGVRPPLVLAGPPWSEDHPLARTARQAGLAGGVLFPGPLRDEDDLALLYSGAALYAQPSLAEGFGLPPLEAMACGTPVLASTGGALPEVLGDAASLLPPRDAGAWAARLAELLGDEGRRAELARRGAERVRRYAWERTAALTREAYREALGPGRGT
jgi:glycosyltransferase involved in cell wall biosynthesis